MRCVHGVSAGFRTPDLIVKKLPAVEPRCFKEQEQETKQRMRSHECKLDVGKPGKDMTRLILYW